MLKVIFSLFLISLHTGCSTPLRDGDGVGSLEYLGQAIRGQIRIWNQSRDLSRVQSDSRLSPEEKELLQSVPEMKAWIVSQGIRATSHYREYFYVPEDQNLITVVMSSPKLRFEPRIFHFGGIGSFQYLGFFDSTLADRFQSHLKDQGLDVDSRPAQAFSSTGWYSDPVFLSMVDRKNGRPRIGSYFELFNVLVHESIHAHLYFKDQTSFNEQLADFFADVLTKRFAESRESIRIKDYLAYQENQNRSQSRVEMLLSTYRQLKEIYQSSLSDHEKEQKKLQKLKDLRVRLGWSENRELNNATLLQFSTYQSPDPENKNFFMRVLEKHNGDVSRALEWFENQRPEFEKHPHWEEWRLGVGGQL